MMKEFVNGKLLLNIANILPHKIKLWCFILVYGADGNGPTEEYKERYDYYVTKHNLKGF